MTIFGKSLRQRAYEAFDRGDLSKASRHFAELIEQSPGAHEFHYMRGLAHKYMRDWATSLHHNLRSIELRDAFDEASAWNAGIAATALGDWTKAREQWTRCGIRIPDGDGPIEDDFGLVSIRLNPWASGETVFARRIDLVRARLLNVPLPESGYRLFDIVLHDGAQTGSREVENGTVPVFNALVRLETSEFRTFVAFVSCESEADLDELTEATLPGIGYVEDWTGSLVNLCLRCSYGAPHGHARDEARDWEPERNLGIAAQSRASVERLLEQWVAGGQGRRVDGIESPDHPIPEPQQDRVWWRGAEDDD